jgi:hypothetical protein
VADRLPIGHWDLVIGAWSLVIGTWSLVILSPSLAPFRPLRASRVAGDESGESGGCSEARPTQAVAPQSCRRSHLTGCNIDVCTHTAALATRRLTGGLLSPPDSLLSRFNESAWPESLAALKGGLSAGAESRGQRRRRKCKMIIAKCKMQKSAKETVRSILTFAFCTGHFALFGCQFWIHLHTLSPVSRPPDPLPLARRQQRKGGIPFDTYVATVAGRGNLNTCPLCAWSRVGRGLLALSRSRQFV